MNHSHSRHLFLLFLFFGLLSLIIAFTLSFSDFSSSSPPSSSSLPSSLPLTSPSPSPQPYLNWQLYQNPKYDYQFKYHPDWDINDSLPHIPQYDTILIQQNLSPLIEISLINFKPLPRTIEELYDRLKRQLPNSTLIQTTNFGRQQIYTVLTSNSNQTSYYFFRKGLVFRLRFFHHSLSQLTPEMRYFLQKFSFF